jgi:ribonucleotide reductase beta subunit family protein with ferritin-like domain
MIESRQISKKSQTTLPMATPLPSLPMSSTEIEVKIPRRRATSVDSGSLGRIVQSNDAFPISLKGITKRRAAKVETLLQHNPNRFVLFPINHDKVWEMYKKAEGSFWTAEELDLSKDRKDWENLNKDERHFISHVLAFFAASDGIVNENLSVNFMKEIQIPEARCFYGFQIAMENIHCVTPNTPILTKKGYFPIGTMADQSVEVWNGTEFSEVTVRKTSDASSIYRVHLDNGMSLDCTDGHKWLVRTGPVLHPERCYEERIMTKDLKVDDILMHWDTPVVDILDIDDFINPYTHGFFCGDGTYTNKYPFVCLYGVKKDLLSHLVVSTSRAHDDKISCYLTNCINKPKYFVPINYSINTKLRWLEGYADADGCTKTSAKGDTAIQIGCVELDYLKEVQLMLTTLGVVSNIKLNREAGEFLMPDGLGGEKKYNCKSVYMLYITCASVQKLRILGFSPKRLVLSTNPVDEKKKLVRIKYVEDLKMISPTYCFNEPIHHKGVFNGILTGQSEVYSLLIDTYIKDAPEKTKLLQAIETIPCVKKKADWAIHWMESEEADFASRLMAFAAVEGIFFSGAFCSIFWLKERGLMPGLTTSNEFISRDEGMHTEFACLLYSMLQTKLSKTKAHKMIKEAVRCEKEFILEALPCALIGMNSKMMSQYLEFVADRLLVQLGYPKIWNTANPFPFMERISLEGKDNFFEKRVTNYSKSGVGRTTEQMTFATDAEF